MNRIKAKNRTQGFLLHNRKEDDRQRSKAHTKDESNRNWSGQHFNKKRINYMNKRKNIWSKHMFWSRTDTREFLNILPWTVSCSCLQNPGRGDSLVELAIGNSRLMTNMTRDEMDAVSDARGEGDCHSLGKTMQTAHRLWLANRAMLKIAASDITAYQD